MAPNRIISFKRIHIYIEQKSRRAGTVDGAAREERPPAVWAPPPGNARAKGGKWGGEKTGGRFFFFETKQSEPNRSLCACFGLRGLQRRSCEKQVVRKGVTRKHPSRNGSGILSMEDGTQALEKLRLNYIFGLAGEHSFGFGKFNKDGSSRRPPKNPHRLQSPREQK